MKKLVLMLLLVTTIIFAGFDKEEFDETQFHSGVKLGVTMSNITGDDVDYDPDYKFGFELGAFTLYRINNLITLQPEILFTQKGQLINYIQNSDIHITMNYLQIPVLLAFKTAPGLKLYIGGYASYLVDTWVSSSSLSSEEESKSEEEIRDSSSDFDAGVILGVMFRGNENMLFDFRYERGFLILDKNTKQDVFNHSFKLSVGWLF